LAVFGKQDLHHGIEQEDVVIVLAEVAFVIAAYLLVILLKMVHGPARERVVTVMPARVRR
jgi:hypothetical protein